MGAARHEGFGDGRWTPALAPSGIELQPVDPGLDAETKRRRKAPFLTVDVAVDKAWSSASSGYPTHVWNDYVSNDPKVAPLAYRPRMVAVGGGYPILEDGKLIGGIGISGGTYQQDQDACVAALTALGFELPA